jgi:hypothetical protein
VSTTKTPITPEPIVLSSRRKRQPLAPKGGNDDVMTPRDLAAAIIAHYNPVGAILDPCRGNGAFYDQFPNAGSGCNDWCELKEGRDFLAHDFGERRFDYCISNPPWSLIRPFLQRAMEVSDNVVFLCLVNAIFMKARLRDMEKAGFALKEILLVPTPPASTGWPQCGFQLGAVHIQRGYAGNVVLSRLEGMKL